MAARLGWADAVSGAPSYVGRALRQFFGVSLAGATAARPLGAITGVRPGTPSSVITATSTTWTVTPFAGVIDLEAAAIAGPYPFAFDTNQTGSVTAADASNPRVDILYVRVSDPAEGDGTAAPVIECLYLAGTAAASPSAPATPARSFVIGQINVPKSGGGAPTVTWVAPYAVAAGGQGNVNTASQLPASGTLGDRILAYDTGILYRFNGTAWKPWESDWITWTPTTTNLTVGSGGSVTALYRWAAGYIDIAVTVVLGTTPTVGATTFSPPVTLANIAGIGRLILGDVTYITEGVNSFGGSVLVAAGGASVLLRTLPSATAATAPISSTVPFTWKATDKMFIAFRAQVA